MSEQHSVQSTATASSPEKSSPAGSVAAAPKQAPAPKPSSSPAGRKWLLLPVLIVVGGLGYLGWLYLRPAKLPEGFASSNGRIEATELDIATKLPGRIKEILVD